MHFEKIFVPDQYDGTAKAAYTALEAQYKKTIADLDANKAARKAFFRKMHPTLFPANIHFPSFQGTLISVNWQHAHMGTTRERQQPIISRRNHFISFVAG